MARGPADELRGVAVAGAGAAQQQQRVPAPGPGRVRVARVGKGEGGGGVPVAGQTLAGAPGHDVLARGSNEGSQRFHNHVEMERAPYDLCFANPISHLLIVVQ